MLASKFRNSFVSNSRLLSIACRNLIPRQRHLSSDKFLSVQKDNDVATLVMQKAPVNSLNLEFLQILRETIVDLENSKDVKGLVLMSACPKVFSAGFDILEMYKPDRQRLTSFWTAVQDFYMTLYTTPLVTMAAVNGHAIAGGFQIMVSCDYRIAVTGPFTYGLNETKLGILAPKWFQRVMIDIIGHRKAEIALQLGKVFSVEQMAALEVIDEVVANSDELKARITENMSEWLKIPASARQATKQGVRSPSIEEWKNMRHGELQSTVDYIVKDKTQQILHKYMEQLRKKQ